MAESAEGNKEQSDLFRCVRPAGCDARKILLARLHLRSTALTMKFPVDLDKLLCVGLALGVASSVIVVGAGENTEKHTVERDASRGHP
jgi:predicted Kef-type K+ transport protein